jgi:hypothetical protein
MRYQIGQVAWLATFENHARQVPCPDCGGTGRLRVLMHDDTQMSVECRNCAIGYDSSTGRVTVHDREPRAEQVAIDGLEVTATEERYRVGSGNVYRLIESERLYDTEAEALVAARSLATQHDEEERKRILGKEKDTRSWAWNASYHRRCIERARKEIMYHESKLAVAAIKAKEDKKTKCG